MRSLFGVAVLAALAGLIRPPAARADNGAGWGTIKGRIVIAGDVPKPEKIVVDKDRMHCLSKGPLYKQNWVVNSQNKGVRWVIVWLTPEPGSENPLPINPKRKGFDSEVVMDQPCCQFVPHCLGMRKGQKLVMKNSAPVPHNVRWTGNPKVVGPGGNLVIPAGKSHTIDDLSTGPTVKVPIVNVNCDFHKWMSARIAVFDHPYFAVTDKDGNFEITDAPAGSWRLKVWHEEIGWRGGAKGRDGMKVTIKAGGVTDVGKLDIKPNK